MACLHDFWLNILKEQIFDYFISDHLFFAPCSHVEELLSRKVFLPYLPKQYKDFTKFWETPEQLIYSNIIS